MRRSPLLIALLFLLGACGGSDGGGTATETTVSQTTTAADESTTSSESGDAESTTTAADEGGDDAAAAADVVEVSLVEWAIEAPTSIQGGSVTFRATNDGGNTHEFAIARGDSYDALPQLDNGAVDEAALGDDWIGRTERIASGDSAEITFDLPAGNYVFLCNIAGGPNSHAALGQVLSVSVGEPAG